MIGRPLLINEIFGPTIQGEGPCTGRHALFVRVFGCNLECTWCDTDYTWAVTKAKAEKTLSGKQWDKAEQAHEMQPNDILDALEKLWPWRQHPTNIVFSGGEPLMQQEGLYNVMMALDQADCPIHIETAGTLMPTRTTNVLVSQFVVSPKLENSKNRASKRYKPDVLTWFNNHHAHFKFVVADLDDFFEIDTIVHNIGIPANHVWIMPEGVSAPRQLAFGRHLWTKTLEHGYNMSLRSHILLWGNERGI